ncbi:UNVERIFIED_CONTAM: LysR family transcriptional activator of glutamate synthase operon [Brevibacillus sp. OAP136]
MEWHQIQYFQTVARTQHFTRAAELLSISQPALSRSISRLEEELGVLMFERQGRTIVLNQYGQRFLQRVERAIQEIEIGKQEILDAIDPDRGNVSLAFLHSLGIEFVPELISSFQAHHPQVTFQLSQASSDVLLDQIRTGSIDIALFARMKPEDGIRWEPLLTEDLYIIVSNYHPLAAFDEVELKEIANEPFIALKRGYGLRNITDKLFKEAGVSPHITFEGEDISTVAGLVATKLGVSLLPGVKVLETMQVKPLRVTSPHCSRTIGIAWKEDRYLPPVAKRFLSFVTGKEI